MTDIDFDRLQPLRLAAGSHQAGSGFGCAMNVISYITGEKTITDYPACSAEHLSRLVQATNDQLARYRGTRIAADLPWGIDLLSPEDALTVIELGMLTIGTAHVPMTADSLTEVSRRTWLGASAPHPLWTPGSWVSIILRDLNDGSWALRSARSASYPHPEYLTQVARNYYDRGIAKVREQLVVFREVHGMPAAPELDHAAVQKVVECSR